jgi:hyperosmotically inducible periplasmic protein
MAQRSVKPRRQAAKLAARKPRRWSKLALSGAKLAARRPRASGRGARLLGRSARGGGKLWAKGKAGKVTGRAGRKGAKTGAKVLKAARSRRPSRARVLTTGAVAAIGAYFLDPQSGKRRRSVATDKAGKWLRRGKQGAGSKASHAGNVAAGTAAQASSRSEREPAGTRLNDPALARKVESEIFRDADPHTRGAVSVNAENGVVYLRGQLTDDTQIGALVAQAQKVEGVRQVENLLHTQSSPAPTKSDGGPGSEAA